MLKKVCLLNLILICSAGGLSASPVTEGRLDALDKDSKSLGTCPLEHTEVSVEIAGFIARVTVEQQFKNPFEEAIEAVYVFPLSERGAVDRMTMRIGERLIKGVVKEKEEARRIYEAARDAGQAASLLDQERPNIFTQSVANIMPGEAITITISYVEYLKYEAGEYAFSFPMVVGPRYIPGDQQGQGSHEVPDADRITPPLTPEGVRAGHDIGLTVHLDAGVAIKELNAELHQVNIERPAAQSAVIQLKNQEEIPNRDFILKYAVDAKEITDALLTHRDEQGGFFTLILHPPERVAPEEARPKEIIFVIDCSGSMHGFPLDKAKKVMRECIQNMNPKDSFNLLSFAGGTGYCFEESVPNTEGNREKALTYLTNLKGRGGTEMMKAIRAALGAPYAKDRLRMVCFMTDGFIGNDMDILDEIQRCRGNARVFAFGIGNGVNNFLIEGMGREGRGASETVTLEGDGDAAAKRFHERIQSPVLTDISLDFGDLKVDQVYPKAEMIPDLFSARPLIITGRYKKACTGSIALRGNTGAGSFERVIEVSLPKKEEKQDVLAPLWARKAIDDLMQQNWRGMQQGRPSEKIKKAIIKLGEEFSLVTQFTSFVAVEEKVINENGRSRRVEVPIELTDGVSYEGLSGAPSGLKHVQAASAYGMSAGKRGMSPPKAPALARVSSDMSMPAPPPVPCTVAEMPAAEMPVVEQEEVRKVEEDAEKKAHPKLHVALQGLESKLVNGAYQDDAIAVRDGKLKVLVLFTDDVETKTKASGGLESMLQQLGAKIVAVVRSSNKALIEISLSDLDRLADQDWVKFIQPQA